MYGVYLPTLAERREILAIHLRLRGRDPARFDLDTLARQSAGYTGADLKEVVQLALKLAYQERGESGTAAAASPPIGEGDLGVAEAGVTLGAASASAPTRKQRASGEPKPNRKGGKTAGGQRSSRDADAPDLTTAHLLAALPEVRPLSRTDPESVAAMTAWLDAHTKPAGCRNGADGEPVASGGDAGAPSNGAPRRRRVMVE